MAAATTRRTVAKPSCNVAPSPVLRHGNPDLAIPDQLSLGSDGRLYLTRSSPADAASAKLKSITLRESVAWFRVGHECSLKLFEGEKFTDWLRMVEQALA